MITYFYILATYFIAASFAFATGNVEPSPFQAGIEAYEKSDYSTAKAKFLAALEKDETAAARHNLGLTELHLDRPAEAAWQLHRALLLGPFNQGYREKLSLVRKQLGLPEDNTRWYHRLSQTIPTKVWLMIASVSFWLLLTALILPVLNEKNVSSHIKASRFFSVLALTVSLTAIGLNFRTLKSGIVLSEETASLHAAPATAAPESGFARPGERASILDQHNNFYQIKTEASVTGWISKNAFRQLAK